MLYFLWLFFLGLASAVVGAVVTSLLLRSLRPKRLRRR